MFEFKDLEKITIEITSNCQASCPMCSRNYHGGILNPYNEINEWTLDDFVNIFKKEVLTQITNLHICGPFGEPVLNKDLLKMCMYLKEENFLGLMTINTNGSARNASWWSLLANSLPINHSVIFSIDGLEDTHSIYRIGTDYEIILKNSKAFIDAGGSAEWAFLKFRHNEHQVKQAEEIARNMGFKEFTVKTTRRFNDNSFDVFDKDGKNLYQIHPASDNKIVFYDKRILQTYKEIVKESTIKCQAETNKEIYIDSAKNIFPCCYISADLYLYTSEYDILHDLKNKSKIEVENMIKDFGGLIKIDKETSIKNVMSSLSWQTIWSLHLKNKPLVCVSNCGLHPSIVKTDDQYVEKLVFKNSDEKNNY